MHTHRSTHHHARMKISRQIAGPTDVVACRSGPHTQALQHMPERLYTACFLRHITSITHAGVSPVLLRASAHTHLHASVYAYMHTQSLPSRGNHNQNSYRVGPINMLQARVCVRTHVSRHARRHTHSLPFWTHQSHCRCRGVSSAFAGQIAMPSYRPLSPQTAQCPACCCCRWPECQRASDPAPEPEI